MKIETFIEEGIRHKKQGDLAGVAQWIECGQTKGSLVKFPVRAHTWVVGQVPSEDHVRGNHTKTQETLYTGQ